LKINRTCIKDAKGKPLFMAAAASNISDRKCTESEMIKMKSRLEYLLKSSPAVIYSAKPKSNYPATYISENVKALTGYNPIDFTRDPDFWFNHIHPEDQKRVFIEVPKLFEKTHHEYEYRFLCQNGNYIWMTDEMELIRDANNEPLEIVGYWANITDRKLAEEEEMRSKKDWETIFNALGHAAMVLDPRQNIIAINKEGIKTLGKLEAEIIGKKCYTLFHMSGPPNSCPFQQMVKYNKTEKVVRQMEILGRTFLISYTPMLDEKGQIEKIIHFSIDITEQKQIEQHLKESEQNYRELADSITDIFFAMDKNLRYTYWNRASEQLLSISAKDAIGKSIFEIFPDNEATRKAVKVYLEVLKTQQSQSFVNEYQLGGNPFSFEITAYPSKEGLSVFVKDITERKRVEELLQDSEAKYRNIIETVRDAVVIIGLDGTFHFISPQLSEMLGGRQIGRDLSSIASLIHKDDVKPLLNAYKKVANSKSLLIPEEVEFRALHKAGYYIWLSSASKVQYDKQGRVIGYIVLLREITARKQAEEELKGIEENLRTLFENAPAAITLLDKSGAIIDCNKATEALVGCSKAEILGNHFEEVVTLDPKDLPQLIGQYGMLLKGVEVEPFDLEIIRKNGERRWISVITSIVKKGKDLVGFQIIANDITTRKIAEEKLKKAIEELKELDRLKDEFYTDISHEYRTPLTAIRGFTELLLQSNNLTEAQKTDLQTILKNESRLERMVSTILEYSRLKYGRVPFKKNKFRVSDICSELKKELAPLIEEKTLAIEERIHPDDELVFDRYQITSVIKNLVTNAIKFSYPGGKIIIKSILNGGLWTCSIQDFGIGIAKEELPKLFTRFIKLKSSEMMNQDGSGIGLAICKNIIDAYGGKIWVESDGLNKGVTFIFQLNLID